MKFTIFTPTYNRAHTLHRVYESLLEQTCRDFEWLVIDDGSTDNTSEMIDRFRKCQSLFPIRYYAQPNRGKHCAHNAAAKLAKGFFTANVDSDDRIIPNTLERCLYWWETLKEKWCGYSGIDGLAVDQYGAPTGDLYPDTPFDSQWNEHKFKHRIKGEHWGIVRTDVLREFPFPSLPSFVPEGVVWGQIGKKYLTRAVNEVFRIYYTHEA